MDESVFEDANIRDVLDADLDHVGSKLRGRKPHDEALAVSSFSLGVYRLSRLRSEAAFDHPGEIVNGFKRRVDKISRPQFIGLAIADQPRQCRIGIRERAIARAPPQCQWRLLELGTKLPSTLVEVLLEIFDACIAFGALDHELRQ